jgi:uncharacterized small protein (DUF1192 family)
LGGPVSGLAGEETDEHLDKPCIRRRHTFTGELGHCNGILEQALGLLEFTELHQRLAELREECEAVRVRGRQWRRRTRQ